MNMHIHAKGDYGRRRRATPLATLAVAWIVGCAPPPHQAAARGREMSPEPPPAEEPIAVCAAGASLPTDRPSSVALELPAPGRERLAALADDRGGEEGWRLVIEDVEMLRLGAAYEVYLEPPEGDDPDPGDPSYLGNLAVFGRLGETPPSSRSFDVGERLKELAEAGMEGAELRLLFVPGDGGDTQDEGGPALRFGRAAIVPTKTLDNKTLDDKTLDKEGDHDP
jgi:hypothetical protein